MVAARESGGEELVAFDAQELIENLAASFTLFGDRVFRIGDTVIHDGEWGMIEDIGFRSTRCRTFDGHLLHIPNSRLLDRTIRNVSARPYLRARFHLSIVYDTPPQKVEEAIDIVRLAIEAQGESIDHEQGVNVVFDDFGAHDLRILVQYYTASDDHWTAKETMSAVNRALLHRLSEAGIAFAFPTRTALIKTDEAARPVFAFEGFDALTERVGDAAAGTASVRFDEDGEDGEHGARRDRASRGARSGIDRDAPQRDGEDAPGEMDGDGEGDSA